LSRGLQALQAEWGVISAAGDAGTQPMRPAKFALKVLDRFSLSVNSHYSSAGPVHQWSHANVPI
jgi:hypothetical protein